MRSETKARAASMFLGGSLALATLLASPAPSAHAESYAIVDLQGAVMQTEDGMRAQAQIKKMMDRRQQELDGRQRQLAVMRSDIERQSRFLSREAITRRMELWQKEMMQLQTVFVEYNKELTKKQTDITGTIMQKMVAIITKIARADGFDIVFDKQATPYSRPDLDITDRVVTMYNSGE